MKKFTLTILTTAGLLSALILSLGQYQNLSKEKTSAHINQSDARASYMKLPLSFEANHGQFDDQVKFTTRGLGYNMSFTHQEAVISLKSNTEALCSHELK